MVGSWFLWSSGWWWKVPQIRCEASLYPYIVINSISALHQDLHPRNNQLIFCIRCNSRAIITNITPHPSLSPPAQPRSLLWALINTFAVSIIHWVPTLRSHQKTLTDNPGHSQPADPQSQSLLSFCNILSHVAQSASLSLSFEFHDKPHIKNALLILLPFKWLY